MLLIAALTIIAFAFLYNTTEMDRVGSNMVAKIYGRTVMQVDVEKAVRNYQLALALGQFELVRDLSGQAQTEDEAVSNFIWNLMVMQHEGKNLNIEPGNDAVVARIKSLPVFQTDGQFDPVKYSDFVQKQLAPRGFTERQLEDVVRDTLRLQEIKALVESPAVALPGDVEPALSRMSPADIVVVEFDAAAVAKDVEVSDEEVRRIYDERKQSLQTPEKRSLRYVSFVLSEDDAKKKGKDRVTALQKTAAETNEFAQGLADSGLAMGEFGKNKKADVRQTPLFDAKGNPDGKLEDEDSEVISAAKQVAFRLQAKGGSYEIIELGDKGYAVIEVAEAALPHPLEFDEARADLRAELIAEKRDRAVADKAAAALPQIREKLAAGEDIKKAASDAGLKTRQIDGLVIFDEDLKPDEREIAMAAADLSVGQLGEMRARPGGGSAVYVAKRDDPDPAKLAERKPQLEKGVLQGKQMLMFAQWLADARRQSGLEMLRPAM